MRTITLTAVSLITFVILVLTAGCSDDPSGPKRDRTQPWPDLSEPEDVIETLLRAYEERNAERYHGILRDPDYLFYFQERDVWPGADSCLTLEEDYDATRRMFLAAMGTPEDDDPMLVALELVIVGAESWTAVDSIGSGECRDCLTTLREYDIKAVALYPTGETTYLGNGLVLFYVQPDTVGGEVRYRIKRLYDIDK
jgi:hypothetical protein